MIKRKLVFCSTQVKPNMVRRETINGVEHIIVTSYTLPDDVIMNGILYPAEEIEKSYKSLERTLAPVEHPTDMDGNFISATDPEAIHNFYAGAYNTNVTREGNRIRVDKTINVPQAMTTEKGKRLLDRVEELENNNSPRPIHTSVGVYLDIEPSEEPDFPNGIARGMVFDHDAILLDSVGAAQPDQGVGMAVNSRGVEYEVEHINIDKAPESQAHYFKEFETNQLSMMEILDQLNNAIRGALTAEWMHVVDVVDNQVVFDTNMGTFMVPFVIDNDKASIVGIPIRADKTVTYTPKTNQQEGDQMKEMILNALKEAGVNIEGLTDDQLLSEYATLNANKGKTQPSGPNANQDQGEQGHKDEGADIAAIVANAVAPLADEVKSLKGQLETNAKKERAELVDLVANSEKYKDDFTKEELEKMDDSVLNKMAANCKASYGVYGNMPIVNHSDEDSVKTDLPE